MKVPTISQSTFLLVILASVAVGQTEPPADSKPTIQTAIAFTMPQETIDAEISGSVTLGVRVEETGKVDKVWIVAGPMWPCGKNAKKGINRLEDALSDTIKNVQFTPAIRNGKAVTENVAVPLKLENPKVSPVTLETDVISGKSRPDLVSKGVLPGKAISLPKPAYPDQARAVRAGGGVSVQIVIDEEGKVKRAGAINGAPELQYAARDAACDAKFSPTMLQGKPIKVTGVVRFNFVPPPLR